MKTDNVSRFTIEYYVTKNPARAQRMNVLSLEKACIQHSINIYGCVFHQKGTMQLLTNTVDNKEIYLHTSSNLELNDNFSARVSSGKGKVVIASDSTGLKD